MVCQKKKRGSRHTLSDKELAMKKLVVYFSAGGVTRKVSEMLAKAVSADIFEIKPEEPYTDADLKWTNPFARCNREKIGKKDVPVNGKISDFAEYDTVFIGFPIWYGSAPNVVNTFVRDYNWNGKKILVFATSGGSGIGKTAEKLNPYLKNGTVADARLISSQSELKEYIQNLS